MVRLSFGGEQCWRLDAWTQDLSLPAVSRDNVRGNDSPPQIALIRVNLESCYHDIDLSGLW